MTYYGRKRAIMTIMLIGLICVSLVVLAAYAAELRCGNNALIAGNDVLQGEIDTLDVKIKAANNVDHIEVVAREQLGMISSDSDRCIYLSDADKAMGNLAMIIRENAYD